MPELPEVETLKRCLQNSIIGATITKVIVQRKDLRYNLPEALPIKALSVTILALRRIAKYLLLDLNNGYSIVVHLGMSGRFTIRPPDYHFLKHDHVIFILDCRSMLVFNDARRFGMIDICRTTNIQSRIANKLGPDPLSEQFNDHYLQEKFINRKIPIKNALMDNTIVVGIGNIYASESLFVAGIDPTRKSCSLAEAELASLVTAIKVTLEKAILAGGTTLKDFVNGDNTPGYFKQELSVYSKQGEQCPRCDNTIAKIKQSGRASFYCPICQK
jgi:formamidopyrimidine-DNA glycosylase